MGYLAWDYGDREGWGALTPDNFQINGTSIKGRSEAVGFSIGVMTGGQTRGRRPDRMAQAYPELQAKVRRLYFKF